MKKARKTIAFRAFLAPTRGLEPPAPRLGGECSVQLSYVGV